MPAHQLAFTVRGTSITEYFWALDPGITGVTGTAGVGIASTVQVEDTTSQVAEVTATEEGPPTEAVEATVAVEQDTGAVEAIVAVGPVIVVAEHP